MNVPVFESADVICLRDWENTTKDEASKAWIENRNEVEYIYFSPNQSPFDANKLVRYPARYPITDLADLPVHAP